MSKELLVPIAGSVVAVVYVCYLSCDVLRMNPGNKLMQDISRMVQDGAKAFLRREYMYVSLLVTVIAILISIAPRLKPGVGLGWATSVAFISGALRTRKMLGGGMRQTGIISAAGIISLEQMVDRLSDDHINARNLAEGIANISGLSIDLETIHTNIIYFDLIDDCLTADEFVKLSQQKGVIFLPTGPSRFRMVTHYGIEPEDIDAALMALREVMQGQ